MTNKGAGRKKKIRENLVEYAIYLTSAFIVLSVILSFWNRHVTYDTRRILETCERVRTDSKEVRDRLVENVDLGVSAFVSTKDEKFLRPYRLATTRQDSLFSDLALGITQLEIDVTTLSGMQAAVTGFLTDAEAQIAAAKRAGSTPADAPHAQALSHASEAIETYFREIMPILDEVEQHAASDYEWSITDNAIIQIILVILSIPILMIASKRLKTEIENRNTSLEQLATSNRKLLYNPGAGEADSVNAAIAESINSIRKASEFVEQVSKGDYSHAGGLIAEDARALNENTLMGALLRMGLRQQQAEKEEQIRKWTAEGLNEFNKIVRNNAHDLKQLADESTSFITRYIKSQQGALFLHHENEEESVLELMACYAFDRKKWLAKRIAVGEGIVGQTFLEGQPTLMTNVPKGYTSITSGLGHATPTCLLVVPLVYDGKTEGVIEIAGFDRYQPHQVDFVKNAGEFLASAWQATKSRHQIQSLLEQAKN
jgi:CHASE3 domain sensor protein/putative methionine-R-sulfoxide reductase with GAF domain